MLVINGMTLNLLFIKSLRNTIFLEMNVKKLLYQMNCAVWKEFAVWLMWKLRKITGNTRRLEGVEHTGFEWMFNP